MSYLALARKWRPKNFNDVVGQPHIVKALANALESGRVHHAYLFAGTRGVGKTTVARILAKALNCEQGVSAEPCGQCQSCIAVDEGRFVDLIEVDAASRTGVDDTRDLLDNVQYRPTGGRYKVYLIDEVHMLSKQAFNALLKTLEEPPPHVKFLFATTDPQRLPVTVLSRCLQFNLKRLSMKLIVGRMSHICEQEKLQTEPAALTRLARAADGSMRDALSLLDQALAFGNEALRDADVADMLGSMDSRRIIALLDGLAAGDASDLLGTIQELDELAPDYEGVLAELSTVLQRIAVVQMAGADVLDEEDDSDSLCRLAVELDQELVQLFYQIAITSRRDLRLAPDPRLGFEMAMLRMIAFRPASSPPDEKTATNVRSTAQRKPSSERTASESISSAAAEQNPPVVNQQASQSAPQPGAEHPEPDGVTSICSPEELRDWQAFLPKLALKGAVRQLAEHCWLISASPFELKLGLDPRSQHLLTDNLKGQLTDLVKERMGSAIGVMIDIRQQTDETVASLQAKDAEQGRKEVQDTIAQDPNIRDLVDLFDAEIVPESVRRPVTVAGASDGIGEGSK